jgi:outer membrane protein assembly factor BamE (lipoprotein component of BamABCDE complex)
MKFLLYTTIIILALNNCTLKKVKDHHGVHFLDKKEKKLVLNQSNKNDIFKLLGPPLIQSTFDNDTIIYVERKTSSTQLINLGKKKTTVNNVLLLEIDNRGILIYKNFLEINQMNDIEFEKFITSTEYAKNTFIYNFLSSLRSKINDPLGKKRRKASQQ